jgi:hypothetical protein
MTFAEKSGDISDYDDETVISSVSYIHYSEFLVIYWYQDPSWGGGGLFEGLGETKFALGGLLEKSL